MKLTRFTKLSIASGVLITVAFIGIVAYSATVMPRMSRESEQALNEFLAKSQERDYPAALSLTSTQLQQELTPEELATQWRNFEKEHGAITRWFPVNDGGLNDKGSGRRVCIFPPFVDYTYAVEGAKKHGVIIYLRVAPQNDNWKIERFSVMRPLPKLGLGSQR